MTEDSDPKEEKSTEPYGGNWPRREYHNNRIYWNFEFFMKAAMAIGGGFAYLIVNEKTQKAENLINLAGLFMIFLGGVSCFNMFSHYRAKRNHAGLEISIWQQIWKDSDFYMFCAVLAMTFVYAYMAFYTDIIAHLEVNS
ncbi:MAG: hypothetical protein CMO07_16235 [Thalassospira sp.]|uniref:hypothetical protein n=1 Tax=unclassified Thalassospira TaxID=2648997 RepID=UPI000C58042D|nr:MULTISPECIES: hypothetical protein [unclassified Thalassospira]MBE72223.1 hypothetical protein [Thalassospira sp.]QPO13734.1 hypothetical protein IT893_09625 [Thalassospira sp. A40-3]|tara:strand:- start:206 stop:625 length:420 start_codon:yes stop_codon:yes gene_type:complete